MSNGNSDELVVERRDGIAIVTLNRPEARNALNRAMRVGLVRLFAELDADVDVAAVVLTGADPAFSGGVDLKEALSRDIPYHPPPTNPAQALRAMGTPVVCAVNGACVSGALEVALACSFIIASDRAVFKDTHARVGLIPSWGLSAMLPEAIGVRRARQMTLTGDPVDPHRALEWGLVNEVVPHAQLLSRAMEIAVAAERVADHVRRATLSLYARGEGSPLANRLGLEAETHAMWKLNNDSARARFDALVGKNAQPTAP
jgi:enoyl-CoA hydratase